MHLVFTLQGQVTGLGRVGKNECESRLAEMLEAYVLFLTFMITSEF